jgi:hypothetical protein
MLKDVVAATLAVLLLLLCVLFSAWLVFMTGVETLYGR